MDEITEFLNNIEFVKSQEILSASYSFWNELKDKSIPDPTVGVGADGRLHFSWRFNTSNYIECEFTGDNIETFYERGMNRDKTFNESVKDGDIDSESFSDPKQAAIWILNKFKENK